MDVQLDTPTLQALAALVREHTGIDINERKRVLLEGRLTPRLRQLGLDSFAQYVGRVRTDRSEVQTFINMVTTNDTAFFRTPAVWTYLAQQFLPDWHAHHPDGRLRIWSAAAASGEEAYSMAMLCEEYAERHPGFRYQIVGTDIDTAMVEVCRDGNYAGRTARLFRENQPQRAGRFACGDSDALSMTAGVRRHVQFGQHNLLRPLKDQAPFDLVLLRNVLIYFDEHHQRIVLGHARRAMAPHGRMIIGEQESLTRLGTPFTFEQQHVYQRGADA